MDGNEVLEGIYNDMNTRNCPTNQEPRGNLTAEGECYAVYALDQWFLKPSFNRFWRKVKEILPENSYYFYRPTVYKGAEGRLHQTLLQFIGFDTVKSGLYTEEEILKATKCVSDVLRNFPKAIWIRYKGLVWTSTGLALAGYCQDPSDYEYIMKIREKIHSSLMENQLPCAIPYRNDILHATVLRWKDVPDMMFLKDLEKEVLRWQECEFGDLRIKKWFMGKASWLMNDDERSDDYSFNLIRHIAHRGNTENDNKVYENNPDLLDELDKHGIDVECDVWYDKERLWLGHDEPQYEIDLFWLASSPRRLIHAKDGVTFQYLIEQTGAKGLDIHFFYHTDEDYVFTNKGVVINYPGEPILEGSIAMMPERASYNLKERSQAFFICSDYSDSYIRHFRARSF